MEKKRFVIRLYVKLQEGYKPIDRGYLVLQKAFQGGIFFKAILHIACFKNL